jgi:hypothetical protein
MGWKLIWLIEEKHKKVDKNVTYKINQKPLLERSVLKSKLHFTMWGTEINKMTFFVEV